MLNARFILPALCAFGILVACSGGGGGGGSSVVPALPGAVGAASPNPSSTPLALSTAPIIPIDGGSTDTHETGITSLFPSSAANSAPVSTQPFNQIDGIPAEYRIKETGRHLHNHITVIDSSGRRIALPQGIGMFGDISQPLDPYPGYALNAFTAGGSSGTYYLHTHDHSGFIHAEDDSDLDSQNNLHPPVPYTLGNLLDIWGETANAGHFTKYVNGPIHIYISQIYVVHPTGPTDATNEVQTAPVEWKGDPLALQPIAADDFSKIPLKSLQEITVEVGNTYYPVPRYYFPAYWCQSTGTTGASDCTLDAAPADTQLTSIAHRP